MINQNIVITGANSGIGYHTTLHFARTGANITMACRSLDKAEQARNDILREVPDARLNIIRLDLSDLNSVREFAQACTEQYSKLDILINNAGVLGLPLTRNDAGYEMLLATNYLGPFALTGLLLPLLTGDTPSRIINVGSLSHRLVKLELNDINWESTPYKKAKSYSQSKILTMSNTLELSRRLQASNSNIIAAGAHPGFAHTDIMSKNSTKTKPPGFFSQQLKKLSRGWTGSPAAAAEPTILAAESLDVKNGDYFGPGGFMEIKGKPAPARINPSAKNPELSRELWSLSESMTGVRYLSDL